MTIRPEQPSDAEGISEVHRRAFGGPDEAELVDALRSSSAFLPDLSLVALVDGEVAGHALFSRVELVGQRPGAAVSLAPMAVMPGLQGRGIGSRLVADGLEASRERGEALAVVLGYPEFYGRFGFGPAHALGVLPPRDWPPSAWMALALRPDHPRGVVEYPPAFAPFL